MRVLPVLLVLGALAAPGAGVAAAPQGGDYFPLVEGTVWVYRTSLGADLVMQVRGTGQARGGPCLVIESVFNGTVTQRECYRREGSVVYAYARQYAAGTVVLDPPQPILILPPAVGRAWAWQGQVGEVPAQVRMQWARAERLALPAGTYDTVQLYLEGLAGPERVQSWRWYAPGIGLAKEDSIGAGSSGNLRVIAELREFRPAR